MKKFHHIGLVTTEEKPGEVFYESIKVWGTSPDDDPTNKVEWVRFHEDSPLASTPVAQGPHISYQVDDLDGQLEGKDVVVAPIQVADNVRIAYFWEDGALVEYLEIS